MFNEKGEGLINLKYDLAGPALFFICLSSSDVQYILETEVFTFLGRISFTLYLSHQLFMNSSKNLKLYFT
jgi:peptidoglycan/LPS O-acetylase OafA/YrhL